MVEAGAKQVTEAQVVGALEAAHSAIKQIVAAIDDLKAACGKPKVAVTAREIPADFRATIEGKVTGPLADAMRIKAKLESYAQVDKVKADMMASLGENADAQAKKDADHIFHDLQEHVMKVEALEKGVRLDGRKFDEIRPIWTETGVLPRVHGSVVFTRGETQALVTCTLGTADDEQKVEHVTGEFYKRFMLHYNFPPFSVGETGRFTGPGRREVGHGALAERALTPLIPAEDKFAYTIRIVSDILESNGSSSMASVCGGSMAMMDAGVPLASPVAGIAMGLIMDEKTGKYAVLSDIAGAEDHYGDMDFKVAGTSTGITALQMDIKVTGINSEIMAKALEQARAGRLHILGEMAKTLDATRGNMSEFAPRIITIKIPVDKIRDVIGPGGKMIRSIIERTGVKIDVEDNGTVNVASADGESAAKAIGIIQELTATPGAEQDLQGQGAAHHRFRRVRRDHGGHRRPAARVRDREPPREGRARRAEGRPGDHGQGDQHRPDRQDPPEPQGAAPAGAREGLIARHPHDAPHGRGCPAVSRPTLCLGTSRAAARARLRISSRSSTSSTPLTA